MGFYGEPKSFNVSGIPMDLIEEYDMWSKRMIGSRSANIRLHMQNYCQNCRVFHQHKATATQLSQWTTNDMFKGCGMVQPEVKKEDINRAGLTIQ